MEITGVDYYFETKYSSLEFHEYFRKELESVWPDYYEEECSEPDSLDYFYAQDKKMFALLDDYGFCPNENGEGTFLLMLGKNGVTLVLPDIIESNVFCKKIHDIAVCKLKVTAQKNY